MASLQTIPQSRQENCGCIRPPTSTEHPCFPKNRDSSRPWLIGPKGRQLTAKDWLQVGRVMWDLHRNHDSMIAGRRRLDIPRYPVSH